MMKAILIVIVVLGLINTHNARVGQAQTIEQIEKYESSIPAEKTIWGMVTRITEKKKLDCLKAFGNQKYCECISENLPMIFGFHAYINITTKSKTENGYDTLNDEYKGAYDKVRPAREKCVARQ